MRRTVTIDARSLNVAHVRGIGRYLSELVSRLPRQTHWDPFLLGARPDHPFHSPQSISERTETKEIRGSHLGTWEQLYLPRKALSLRSDLIHSAGTTAPLWQPRPLVVTVHDTKPWATRRRGWDRIYWHRIVSAAIRRADAIITPSQSSYADIVEKWPSMESRVHVIPHGLPEHFLHYDPHIALEAPNCASEEPPYILYIGGPAPSKRFHWALQILSSLNPRWKHVHLRVCGFSPKAASSAAAQLPQRVRSRVEFLPFVPDGKMPALYRNAMAVLYPTTYEGFGFPVIESQASLTPILVSPSGSLSELAGPEVHFLAEKDLEAWTSTLEQTLERRSEDVPWATDSFVWAQGFSWESSVTKHAHVYNNVI